MTINRGFLRESTENKQTNQVRIHATNRIDKLLQNNDVSDYKTNNRMIKEILISISKIQRKETPKVMKMKNGQRDVISANRRINKHNSHLLRICGDSSDHLKVDVWQ
uniref:Uncharacterized protein n=1 Tax=Onchocerca volvulus TaxID=6282 RepID=A0A8R1XY27_ONCVO